MKKVVTLILAVVMIMACMAPVSAAEESAEAERDFTKYLWEIPEDASDEEFLKLMERNFRIIQAFELLFTEESYEEYSNIYKKEYKRTKSIEDAHKVEKAQDVLVQKISVADGVWFLWGEKPEDNANGYGWFTGNVGPVVDGEEETLTEEVLDASEMDGFGQGPVLIKQLLDDPTQAKGNIVLVSGGGYHRRSNPAEGYAGVRCFKELGYNCFLLQRRVEPYSTDDIYMDMQRAIRLVRYYCEKEGWGGQDMIAAAGFSGGGRTIIGSIRLAYGMLTPADEGATSYIPDEIDSISSDLDVALIAYGNSDEKLYREENKNWPATYITYGLEDSDGVQNGCMGLYEQIKDVVPAQIYPIADVGHGFGVGQTSHVPAEVADWPIQADIFMMEHKGFSSNRGEDVSNTDDSEIGKTSVVPEKYTKAKSFYGIYSFSDSDVFYAMNEDETEFYAKYKVMSHENILEGTVKDGIVTVTYNAIGYASDDAQVMYEDAMTIDTPWESIA